MFFSGASLVGLHPGHFQNFFLEVFMVNLHFFGSRSFSDQALVSTVVSAWLVTGGGVVCGSSAGADALVISSVLAAGGASSLQVLAAFARSGAGAGACSSVVAAKSALACNAAVVWLAGGPLSVPLHARLAARTASAASLAAGGVVFSSCSPLGPGSSLAVSCLVARRCPVWLFGPAPVAVRGVAGSWVPSVFCGLPCFRFAPAQLSFGF
jgi:hypothetical protein